MTKLTFDSAGVSLHEIDKSGPVTQEPVGIPAGVIGVAKKGPAFVPVTFGIDVDFISRFGNIDGSQFGPLAVAEWLRNATAATYIRVLGAGTALARTTSGDNAGIVTSAGFVVGEQQPIVAGALGANQYANANGTLGRTHILGCYMSESLGSTHFSTAGIQGSGSPVAAVTSNVGAAVPIVRGIIMAPSGVILSLSSSHAADSSAPASTHIAGTTAMKGAITGTVKLLESTVAKEEFVMLLNGHKGTDSNYPNVITASFTSNAANYFPNVFNTDPLKYQQAGHYLYTHYDIHPALAVATGTALITASLGAGGSGARLSGAENIAFLTTGALARNTADTYAPNYENFEDRFSAARSPYVISQKFGGSPINLFRIDSRDDGEYSAQKIKISIENIAASSDETNKYGTFDLIVRSLEDVDDDISLLENFRGLSLNPSSDRYIAKLIGDQNISFDFDKTTSGQKLILDGSYPNKSNYIRVTMATKVADAEVDPTALPMGFRGMPHLVTSGTLPLTDGTAPVASTDDDVHENSVPLILKHTVQLPVPLRTNITTGPASKTQASANLYWGVKFQQTTTVNEPNKSQLFNATIKNMARYLPDFMATNQDVVAKANEGTADTAQNGIIDVDRFNNNIFTLENVQVTTASDTRADTSDITNWSYIRKGGIVAVPASKTRAMRYDDFKKQSVRPYAKFSFFLQGGFDGVNIFNEEEAGLTNAAIREEMNNATRGQDQGPTVKAYKKAISIMKNTADVDIKLLAIPGIREATITDEAAAAVKDRFDAMYIMDIPERDELNSVVTSSLTQKIHVANTTANHTNRALNTNFAAAYFPDVIMTVASNNKSIRVPPTTVVLGAFALNDSVGFPWLAAAGFTRGALASTTEAAVQLNRDNLDELYAADINPIVAFPDSNGPIVWGQKTLQAAKSALDRVNVRRLLIEVRRSTREVAKTILFEPNREATLARFQAAVKPKLESVQQKQGINRFKVVIDSSTTSQADVENNTIRGKIWLEPVRTAEVVSLDFVVTNQGSQA